jgi:hypothetical protein
MSFSVSPLLYQISAVSTHGFFFSLVANFHTHPLSALVGGDPHPSRADMDNAYYRGLPGIVVSRPGIYSYGPERRENTSNPKGDPPSIDPPAVPTARLAKVQPPPWTVPNQWPEGTGLKAVTQQSSNKDEPEIGGGADVIVVEWSDEGVEYGEPLVESED